jgi:dolichol-phosphate mannosyltransferase
MAPDRILLFIPAYNCAAQIGRVIGQLNESTQAMLSEVIVVDNGSTDNTREVARSALSTLSVRSRLFRNDGNYGLGGSHKVAFEHALAIGCEYLIVLHGDDQGSISDIVPFLLSGAHRDVDALLGARFMKGSRLEGYSVVRTLGNHVFNALYSIAAGKSIKDLGSGLNLYRVEALKSEIWRNAANDLTFNYHMILRSVAAGWRLRFFPLTWRESDQVSNVKLFSQAIRVAGLPLAFIVHKKRYLATDYSDPPLSAYPSSVIFDNRTS